MTGYGQAGTIASFNRGRQVDLLGAMELPMPATTGIQEAFIGTCAQLGRWSPQPTRMQQSGSPPGILQDFHWVLDHRSDSYQSTRETDGKRLLRIPSHKRDAARRKIRLHRISRDDCKPTKQSRSLLLSSRGKNGIQSGQLEGSVGRERPETTSASCHSHGHPWSMRSASHMASTAVRESSQTTARPKPFYIHGHENHSGERTDSVVYGTGDAERCR